MLWVRPSRQQNKSAPTSSSKPNMARRRFGSSSILTLGSLSNEINQQSRIGVTMKFRSFNPYSLAATACDSVAPPGLVLRLLWTHGLRHGLRSTAAPRLCPASQSGATPPPGPHCPQPPHQLRAQLQKPDAKFQLL